MHTKSVCMPVEAIVLYVTVQMKRAKYLFKSKNGVLSSFCFYTKVALTQPARDSYI